ncbi:hypothetical protein AG1IA_07756 [Rhizoctonia solani AG-1 IA]|uniref:Uncharacterized protein n=1 Tax=Thanatephorus cucumeris (strain AG1-IA) TaxID=983506 RepID=L8WN70_THACA|nr:hypothetical protein AG1IA_07756 [Rhizoctonia solani AG-1 IA]
MHQKEDDNHRPVARANPVSPAFLFTYDFLKTMTTTHSCRLAYLLCTLCFPRPPRFCSCIACNRTIKLSYTASLLATF